jgi:putative chitinase
MSPIDSVAVVKLAIPQTNTKNFTVIDSYIKKHGAKYGVDTTTRLAAFIAQASHETGGFNFFKEFWGPTAEQKRYDPPSQKSKNLGNLAIGEGYKYRGRGIFQYTGKSNYKDVSMHLFGDQRLLQTPDLLSTNLEYATLSALHYWNKNKLSTYADKGDFQTISTIINGGDNGRKERFNFWVSIKSQLLKYPEAFAATLKKKSSSNGTGISKSITNSVRSVYDYFGFFFTGK